MKTYSINELEKLTGIPPRTIHFYVRERLIPPPSGRGGPAKYGEEHLVGLQMLLVLKGAGLKIASIRDALRNMSLDEMRQRLTAGAESGRREWDDASIGDLLSGGREMKVPVMPTARGNMSFAGIGKAEVVQPAAAGNMFAGIKRTPRPLEDSWSRVQVADGVEVNLRSDVPERVRELVRKLIEDMQTSI